MLKVRIINPDAIVYDGDAEYVLVPTPKGDIGLMPGHTPLFTELIKGTMYLKNEKEELMAVESGILKIREDIVTILIGPA